MTLMMTALALALQQHEWNQGLRHGDIAQVAVGAIGTVQLPHSL